jgi:hypothetical protein
LARGFFIPAYVLVRLGFHDGKAVNRAIIKLDCALALNCLRQQSKAASDASLDNINASA